MIPFYERSEAERIALTEAAIARKATTTERWVALAAPEADAWNARSAVAAEWLRGQASVLDLGCGTMTLEGYLDCVYIPSDVARRDDRTIVRDYNLEGPPDVQADAAACLGLLEYLHDPEAFMAGLSTRNCVLSYCTTDAPSPLEPRRSHAWVNDFSRAEVEAMVARAGWSISRSRDIDSLQVMWLLDRE